MNQESDPFQSTLDWFFSNGPLLIPLPKRSWITVRGSDAQRYLNGQLSNRVDSLEPGSAIRACLLTVKGKLVAAPYCWRTQEEDAFVLEVEPDLEEATLARLDRYLVADDVTLETASAPEEFHACGIEALSDDLSARTVNRFGLPGFDLSADSIANLGELRQLTPDEAELLRIAGGMPAWGREIEDSLFPADCGLDRIAVDFHKGCYVGQEVVSRLQSVGRPKWKTVRMASRAEALPEAGTELVAASDGASAGKLTSIAKRPDGGGFLALARIPRSLLGKETLFHASQTEIPPVEIHLCEKE